MTPEHPCARCRERLPWFAAGALSPSERDEVERHLATCDACRREAALWREVGPALQGTLASPPPDTGEDEAWRALRARLPRRRTVTVMSREELAEMNTLDPSPTGAPASGSSRRPPRRPVLAVTAFVLLVALSAALFAVLSSRGHLGNSSAAATMTVAATPASTVPTVTSCAPGQINVRLPSHSDLLDVSMVSATDGWAVGQIWDRQQSNSLPQTLITRLVNCRWSVVGRSISSAALTDIAMTAPDDGWAVGMTAGSASLYAWQPDQLILLHYTHGAWQRVPLNDGHFLVGHVLRMISPSEGWLYLIYQGAPGSILYHYQNGVWNRVPLPSQLQSRVVYDLAASGPNDCWLVANTDPTHNNSPIIAHYTNGHWQFWSGALFAGLAPRLDTVRIVAPASVWVLGIYSYQNATGSTAGPFILRYDGSRWIRVTVTGLGSSPPEFAFWTTAIALPTGGVLLLGSGNITQGPDNPNVHSSQHTLPLRCTGNTCRLETFPLATISLVFGVSLYSPTQGDAVGCTPDPATQSCNGLLLAYDNGSWSILPGQ